MQASGTLTFRSAVGPLWPICRSVGLFGSVAFVFLAALGQYRAGRFPSYSDLLLSAAIPWAIAGAIALLFIGGARVFTVKLVPGGIRCYDTYGIYQTAQWSQVVRAERVAPFGLPYVYVTISSSERPLTVPLWLEDMPQFVKAVECCAGSSNPLTRALSSAA